MMTEDNDYHRRPIPKGPSAPLRKDQPVATKEFDYRDPDQKAKPLVQRAVPADEADRDRWARIKVRGYLSLTPADLEWLLVKAREAVF